MPESGVPLKDKQKFMSTEEIVEMANIFVSQGVKKIRLTGGEPLVKKDAHSIITKLGELPIELSITTNAVLADQFIATFQKAGIQKINVSLDSLKEERINTISRRSYAKKIMENIQLLLSHHFEVKINVVLMKNENDDEIIDFINWTKDVPVNIRFIEFMPFDGNRWKWDKKVTHQSIMDRVEQTYGSEAIERLPNAPNDTSRNFKIKHHQGSFGTISTITNPFCDTCNRIRLTADGKIKNCLFSNDETDLLTPLRAGKDIVSLIHKSMHHKHQQRAGIQSFNAESDKTIYTQNRSMITIGG